jgi:hypothetical protein
MILTHESVSQEDQCDGKKRRPKISWYYPFKISILALVTELYPSHIFPIEKTLLILLKDFYLDL